MAERNFQGTQFYNTNLRVVSALWMKSSSMAIRMKAIEQYFPVVLFSTLYRVVLISESVHEILKCDHSNESY